jgi:hypothetical protein
LVVNNGSPLRTLTASYRGNRLKKQRPVGQTRAKRAVVVTAGTERVTDDIDNKILAQDDNIIKTEFVELSKLKSKTA